MPRAQFYKYDLLYIHLAKKYWFSGLVKDESYYCEPTRLKILPLPHSVYTERARRTPHISSRRRLFMSVFSSRRIRHSGLSLSLTNGSKQRSSGGNARARSLVVVSARALFSAPSFQSVIWFSTDSGHRGSCFPGKTPPKLRERANATIIAMGKQAAIFEMKKGDN